MGVSNFLDDYINLLILISVPNILMMYIALCLTTTGFCVIVQSIFAKIFEKPYEITQEINEKNDISHEMSRGQP